MYDNIRNSMEALYEDALEAKSHYNKHNYERIFKELYDKYSGLLQEIIDACEEADDSGELLDEFSRVIPEMVSRKVEMLPKRKKEFEMLDYNMALVTFYTPILNYNRNKYCETLAVKMVDCWNEMFETGKLTAASYETIQSGFKNRLCYVTTAVCESQGKPDNCYELNLLRNYRDQYLLKEAGEKALVYEYYNVAPTIVKRISRQKNPGAVYDEIWDTYLKPCIQMIENDKKEECKDIYCDMVRQLQKRYLYS